MVDEVVPLRIVSVSVKQDEEEIEAASLSGISDILISFDRAPLAIERSEVRSYFDIRNDPKRVLTDPVFNRSVLRFSALDPNAAVVVVEYLRAHAKNIAERTEGRRAQAAQMLSDLEARLQEPRGEGDFRPVTE